MPGKTGNEKSPFFYFSNYEFASNRVTLFLERFQDERAHAPSLWKSVPLRTSKRLRRRGCNLCVLVRTCWMATITLDGMLRSAFWHQLVPVSGPQQASPGREREDRWR